MKEKELDELRAIWLASYAEVEKARLLIEDLEVFALLRYADYIVHQSPASAAVIRKAVKLKGVHPLPGAGQPTGAAFERQGSAARYLGNC